MHVTAHTPPNLWWFKAISMLQVWMLHSPKSGESHARCQPSHFKWQNKTVYTGTTCQSQRLTSACAICCHVTPRRKAACSLKLGYNTCGHTQALLSKASLLRAQSLAGVLGHNAQLPRAGKSARKQFFIPTNLYLPH